MLPADPVDPMARTRNALKRQKVATVESALFNPDVVFLLAALLDARDLCQVSLTCKTLGGKQAAYSGLSLVEDTARRMFECASVWEWSCLKKYDDEGWIELYRHLLMLRSKLTFDQLVGGNIQYGDDQSIVRASNDTWMSSTALCSDHVMRSGRHFSVFTQDNGSLGIVSASIGIVRPVQIDRSDFDDGELDNFCPSMARLWGYLRGKRTERWGASNVHCCNTTSGRFYWSDWTTDKPSRSIAGFQHGAPIGLLLDLDEGTLSLYQNGQMLATLEDGLSGEYCWYVVKSGDDSVTIERRSAPGE